MPYFFTCKFLTFMRSRKGQNVFFFVLNCRISTFFTTFATITLTTPKMENKEKTINLIDDNRLRESGRDSLDNEVWVFDDFDSALLQNCPLKLDMPIFALCLQGEVTLHVNLTDYTIRPNCLISLQTDNILQGLTVSDDAKGIFVGVTQKFIDEILPDIHTVLPIFIDLRSSPVIEISDDDSMCLQEFHALLWKRIKSEKGAYRKSIIQNILRAMLYKMLDIYKTRDNYAVPAKRSRNEEIFFNFARLVERDFKVERSVQYYADKLFITPKHLSSVIKTVSGQTASDWINNFVILAAKVMLRTSSKTVLEVSNELNFTNQSFFGKYFKLHTGMSPQSYRQRCGEE